MSYELVGKIDSDGRYVHSAVVHTPPGKPHRSTSPATGQLKRIAFRREEFLVGSEFRGRAGLIQRGNAIFGVTPVPIAEVCFAHRRNDT